MSHALQTETQYLYTLFTGAVYLILILLLNKVIQAQVIFIL